MELSLTNPQDVVIKREMCVTDVGSIYYKDTVRGLSPVSYEGYNNKTGDKNDIVASAMGAIDSLLEKISIHYNIEKSNILICYDKNNLPVPSLKHSLLICLNNGTMVLIFKRILVEYMNDMKGYEWKLDKHIDPSLAKYLKEII